MIHCNIFFVSLLISSVFPVHYAFTAEKIVGGYPVFALQYRYQAAIIGKYNTSLCTNLLASAVIISPGLLLATARTFFANKNKMKKQTFYAVVGQFIISATNAVLRDINEIYTYLFRSGATHYDLAVVRLKESLDFVALNLEALELPEPYEEFYNLTGDVSGYGINRTDNTLFIENRERLRLYKIFGQELSYAFVKITSKEECKAAYKDVRHITSMCGVMEPDERNLKRGLCLGDAGSPLHISNKVVGIASRHGPGCDDTIGGSIYTKVSYFQPFIKAIKQGNPLEETIVHNNLPLVQREFLK